MTDVSIQHDAYEMELERLYEATKACAWCGKQSRVGELEWVDDYVDGIEFVGEYLVCHTCREMSENAA